jgi:hypothetical protein
LNAGYHIYSQTKNAKTKPIVSMIIMAGQIYLRSDREPSENTRTPFAAVFEIAAKIIAIFPVANATQ